MQWNWRSLLFCQNTAKNLLVVGENGSCSPTGHILLQRMLPQLPLPCDEKGFGRSTHLSESNMRPIYVLQLPFHLVPFILITSGALFHLTIGNSQKTPLLEQLLFLQIIQSPPLFTKTAEGSLDCQIQRLLLSHSTTLVLCTTPLPFASLQTLCGYSQCLVHTRNT